jgi:hypothetical protein
MIKRFLTAAVLATLFISSLPTNHAWAQTRCARTMLAADWKVGSTWAEKIKLAKEMVESGTENDAYVVKWRALNAKAQGPLDPSGELLVVGVRTENFAKWMEDVGEHSIGLAVDSLPESNPGTAYLRIGNRLFSFSNIQNARDGQTRSRELKEPGLGWVEATFTVTKAEMDAILDFIAARGKGIPAAQDVPRAFKKGELIRPYFEIEGYTLKRESCAGACTSWFDPKWLVHYTGKTKDVLVNLARRLNIEPTFVAKRNVWQNARNSNTMSITVVGIDQSKRIDPEKPLIETNKWYNLRGLPVYGLIPDPVGDSRTVEATRMDLREWLRSKRVSVD